MRFRPGPLPGMALAMVTRCGLVLCLAAAIALAAQQVFAGPSTQDPSAALRAAADADDLALAALVAQLGDDAVLSALTQHEDVSLRLAAVRGAAYLRTSALALPALIEIASGRDPDLAPLAARRVRAVSQAIALEGQRRVEGEVLSLDEPRKALNALAEAEGTRADIRIAAGEAAALLAR